MKNPAPFVRKSLYAILNNTIIYEAASVPCYESEAEDVPNQILITETSVNSADTKHSFVHEVEQLIEVISGRKVNTSKHVDAIGETVMNLIRATPLNQGVANSSVWQWGTIKRATQNPLTEQSPDGSFIKRLILRYQFTLTEK